MRAVLHFKNITSNFVNTHDLNSASSDAFTKQFEANLTDQPETR